MSITNEFSNYILNEDVRNMNNICNINRFEHQKHQKFIGEYMKKKQKDNPRILLYHGLGSGKTCTSILVAEMIKTKHKALVVVPASLIENYKKELMSSCVKNNKYITIKEKQSLYTVNVQTTKEKQKYNELLKRINKRIMKDYEIISYQGFVKQSKNNKLRLKNRLLIIDEVQNIISFDGLMYNTFHGEIVMKNPENLKLILLSGTPMTDRVNEIALVINLLNDSENQIGGNFVGTFFKLEKGKRPTIQNEELLNHYFKNKISYFKGVSPNAYPSRRNYTEKCMMSDIQYEVYEKTIDTNLINMSNEGIYQRAFLIGPRQAANVVYSRKKTVGLSSRPKDLKADDIVSSKFERAVYNLKRLVGPCFVYSNFVTAAGVDDFSIFIKNHGFEEYDLRKKPNSSKKYFYVFRSGATERNTKILSIFNSYANKDGNLIKFIMGSPVMKEGITLLRVRSVHLLDPYWNNSRTEQIIGRAIRYCSHKDLPDDERKVSVYHYIAETPDDEISIDEYIQKISNTKNAFIKSMDDYIKRIAFDCNLFKKINNVETCQIDLDPPMLNNNDETNIIVPFESDIDDIYSELSTNKIRKFLYKFDIYVYSTNIIKSYTKKKEYYVIKDKINKVLNDLFGNNINIRYALLPSSYKNQNDICLIYPRHRKPIASSIPVSINGRFFNAKRLAFNKLVKNKGLNNINNIN